MHHLCVIKGRQATLGGIKTTRLAPFPTAPTATYCYPMDTYNILAMCALQVPGSRGGSFLRKKSFFVTLEKISNCLCLSEVWEIARFSRLRTGNLLISIFFCDMRIVRALNAEPPAFINGSLSGARVHRICEITKFLKIFIKKESFLPVGGIKSVRT